MATLRGELARDEMARFLRACRENLKPEQNCFVWNGWQSTIAMLGLVDLKPLVAEAFERGSIHSTWLSFEHFERDLEDALGHAGTLPHWTHGEYDLFGDTVEELSKWYGFSEQYLQGPGTPCP